MQAAKDTFLKTLAGRLAALNAARTVVLDGSARPAVVAVENETAMPTTISASTPSAHVPEALVEVFLLCWDGAGHAGPEGSLMYVDCKVAYASKGTNDAAGSDRGRVVTAMDAELLAITEPRQVAKCDYTQTPAVQLGTNVFWTRPELGPARGANGVLLRETTLRVFFFPEVG